MSKNDKTIRGFKGFDKDLKCRDFQYEVGKEYEHKGEVSVCNSGFHFCENPLKVFEYYAPSCSRYCEVEGSGSVDKDFDDSKVSTSHIHILAEIDLEGLIKAGLRFIFRKIDLKDAKEHNACDYFATTEEYDSSMAMITAENAVAINAGDSSVAATSGFYSVASNSGEYSVAVSTGSFSAAASTGCGSLAMNTGLKSVSISSGVYSVAANVSHKSLAENTGDYSLAACTGCCSVASNVGEGSAAVNTGDHSTAKSTGPYSVAINTGEFSSATVEGKESVAIAIGKDCCARGVLGSWIVLTEWGRNDRVDVPIKEVKAFKVDGVNVKENTFYRLVDGKPVEVEQ